MNMEKRKTASEMQMVAIDKLVPYANNARTHSPEQISKLRSSLREFGFINPVIIDRDYGVIAGHGRIMAAREEGISEVPCVFVDHLTEAQKKAYIIADNRMAMDAGWDEEMLRVELEALEGYDFDLALTGFDEKELAALFGSEEDAQEDGFDVDAALEAGAFVEKGDVWLLGRHRLLCGDSTISEDVHRLMDGKKANLLVTDAPYNVDYEGGTGMKIVNDKMGKREFYEFLYAAFKNGYESLADGASAYFFHSDSEKVNFYNAAVDAGFKYMSTCIWVKNALVLGRGDFQQAHEPVGYYYKNTGPHKFYGDRTHTTVWEFDRPTKSKLHPTMKPIPLTAYPIRLSSQENGIVLDLFGGSGTTLIACEQLNRVCCMMEYDPKYASAIVRRYAAARGGTDDVRVMRGGEMLPCSAVYIPSAGDLAYADASVDAQQKGSKKRRKR